MRTRGVKGKDEDHGSIWKFGVATTQTREGPPGAEKYKKEGNRTKRRVPRESWERAATEKRETSRRKPSIAKTGEEMPTRVSGTDGMSTKDGKGPCFEGGSGRKRNKAFGNREQAKAPCTWRQTGVGRVGEQKIRNSGRDTIGGPCSWTWTGMYSRWAPWKLALANP